MGVVGVGTNESELLSLAGTAHEALRPSCASICTHKKEEVEGGGRERTRRLERNQSAGGPYI